MFINENSTTMTVEEYFKEWWAQELPEKGFNKTAMLDFAEMYHKQALRVHGVVGRSEQFYCDGQENGKDRCETQCLGCAGMQEIYGQ